MRNAPRTALALGVGAAITALVLSGCTPSSGGGGSTQGPVSQEDIDKAMTTPTKLTFWTLTLGGSGRRGAAPVAVAGATRGPAAHVVQRLAQGRGVLAMHGLKMVEPVLAVVANEQATVGFNRNDVVQFSRICGSGSGRAV